MNSTSKIACIALACGAALMAGCKDRPADTHTASEPMASASNPTDSPTMPNMPTASQPEPQQATSSPTTASPATSDGATTDAWAGKWNGPEGTYLQINGQQGRYEVTIANLDGPRTFPGQASNGQITFTRDGVAETLKPTNGQATGMKWLADKKDCLTVRTGEGYCRD